MNSELVKAGQWPITAIRISKAISKLVNGLERRPTESNFAFILFFFYKGCLLVILHN